jgi:hypothetical protein
VEGNNMHHYIEILRDRALEEMGNRLRSINTHLENLTGIREAVHPDSIKKCKHPEFEPQIKSHAQEMFPKIEANIERLSKSKGKYKGYENLLKEEDCSTAVILACLSIGISIERDDE